MAALVEACQLVAKAEQVIKSGRLTSRQLDYLEWMVSEDGMAAQEATPEAFEGVDKEIFGFDFLAKFEEVVRRENEGYSGSIDEKTEWMKRRNVWERAVCNESLLPRP